MIIDLKVQKPDKAEKHMNIFVETIFSGRDDLWENVIFIRGSSRLLIVYRVKMVSSRPLQGRGKPGSPICGQGFWTLMVP
jgi:hypothetical protein